MDSEYVPIYFVDHSIDCSYAHKASNVQLRGGRIMLISSDSNILEEEYNVDDPTESVRIPTVIVTKDFGDIIREYVKLKQDTKEFIVLSMKFSGVKESGNVEIELFMRSDDMKARYFFNDFFYYKEKLGPKLKFVPIYKYSKFVNEQFDNELSEKSTVPCIKQSRMCATPNHNMQIENPRRILLENIRETCIYQEFGLDIYWKYMKEFNELCFDLKNPLFNGECANSTFQKIGQTESDIEILEKCMKQLIDYESKVDNDYNTFAKRKIYSIPDLFINGVPYRGNWYSKYIFRGICSGFLDDEKICEPINPREVIYRQRISNTVIVFIIIITACVTICSLLCYKKFINSTLEEAINYRINEQAMKTISQYQSFPSKDLMNEKIIIVF